MRSQESEEFLKYRRDLEAQEAHKANPHPLYKTRYWQTPRINEKDPRDRD